MKNLMILLVLALSLSSCGLFLQNNGVKNYKPRGKVESKGLNDYQYDFVYLTQLVEETFPLLDSIFPLEKRNAQRDQILIALSHARSNTDFILQARKYLSNLKNQHTSIALNQEFKAVYPYVVYSNSESWHLLNIARNYDSVHIGKKIILMNDVSYQDIEERLTHFTFAENRINQQQQVRSLQLFNKPEYLKDIGVIKDVNEPLRITFDDGSTVSIVPISTKSPRDVYSIVLSEHPVTRYKNQTYWYQLYNDQNIGYLQFNRCHDKIDILDGLESYVKPWVRPLAKGYVKRQFRKENPSKRFARYYNPRYPIFQDFVRELVDSLHANQIEHLVIDVRNNGGGNLVLGKQLMYFLTSIDSLTDFTDYAFTSAAYKKYFKQEYQELQQKYSEDIPDKSLVVIPSKANVFSEVTDKQSPYFVAPDRPVYKGNIYVLANYGTGSAAALLTILMQDNNIATIIGTNVGNNAIGATTYTPMKLPRTKAVISIASTYKERPKKEKGVLQIPDHWVERSLQDLLDGNDPYWNWVIKNIKDQ